MKLYALHGNLQLASVWDSFEGRFSFGAEPVDLVKIDLWRYAKLPKITGFWSWAAYFNQQVLEKEPQLLMGYSLGGRLALHALLLAPERWRGAVIIAADSGFSLEADKLSRIHHDEVWAKRFLSEDWQQLLKEWDAQGVFGGRANPHERFEADFDRRAIAHYFRIFSKGRQDDLLPALANYQGPPILFISGQEDPKFKAIGERLAQRCSQLRHVSLAQAAHRVPWENPLAFEAVVEAFFAKML
ncbi:MAG: alpha/beta fold hydrolase [Deinococcales bacterium]